MRKLNVLPPTLYARVSDHIPLIIEFIEKLIDKGFAYACPSGKICSSFSRPFIGQFFKVRFISI